MGGVADTQSHEALSMIEAARETGNCAPRVLKLPGAALVSFCLISGCSEAVVYAPCGVSWQVAKLAVFPFRNLTEYPHAGEVVTELWHTALRARGFKVSPSGAVQGQVTEGDPPNDLSAFAGRAGALYVSVGSVTEYRYRLGQGGAPAVGITVEILDVQDGKVVWRGSASQAGSSGDTLSQVALRVCRHLAETIPWKQ